MAALLVACGNADGDGSPGGTEAGDSFPMTINGAFGRTRIDRKPERIAAVGFLRDGDDALALGVTPVAMTANDLFPESFAPWTLEALGSAGTTVLNAPEGLLPFERIAAAQPDLILATDDRTLGDHHDRLAGIAPTLAYTIGGSRTVAAAG